MIKHKLCTFFCGGLICVSGCVSPENSQPNNTQNSNTEEISKDASKNDTCSASDFRNISVEKKRDTIYLSGQVYMPTPSWEVIINEVKRDSKSLELSIETDELPVMAMQVFSWLPFTSGPIEVTTQSIVVVKCNEMKVWDGNI